MTHDVVHLARSLQLDSLETAWEQAVKSPKPDAIQQYLGVVDSLCDQAQSGRAFALANMMVEALAAASALDSAIDLATRVVKRGVHNEALAKRLLAMLEQRFAEENWWETIRQRAGIDGSAANAQALLEFDRLRRFTKGHVVYHQAGWGEGVVLEFRPESRELAIQFATGRKEAFPFDTVIDRFKPLDHEDLRAMKLLRLADLKQFAEKDPSRLIRIVAKLYRGTVSSAQLKQELIPSVIEEKGWAGYWKRAKLAATKDPWLKAEGTATRPSFVLRDRPVGLAEEAQTAMRHENNLGGRIAVLRDFLARGQDDEVRAQILDVAQKTVDESLGHKKDNHAHILDGILFLEEYGRKAATPASVELRALLVGPDGALHPAAIDRLATQLSREHAVKLLPEAVGEHWVDRTLAVLPDVPNSVLENVVQAIVDAKCGERLLDLWDRVVPHLRRYPLLTYLLGRACADGTFDKREDRPDPVTVGRVLMHLARVLSAERKGNVFQGRLLSRLTSLLTGKRGYLHRSLESIGKDDLASYLGISERGGEDFPPEISNLILRAVADKFPELAAKDDVPFWEREDAIFTTIAGMKRIKDDYRILVEEKIPANSKAIGAAASLGDLSENSEWESAMEEQRNLTTRATEMDQSIRMAKLIEDQEIPDDVVAPGTRITYTEVASGKTRTYAVLGPWDVVDDHTINYRAPIAQGLLGRAIGDTGEVPSPSGPVTVRIDAIERM